MVLCAALCRASRRHTAGIDTATARALTPGNSDGAWGRCDDDEVAEGWRVEGR